MRKSFTKRKQVYENLEWLCLKCSKGLRRVQPYLFALFSTSLLIKASPGSNLYHLVWIAFVPILIAIKQARPKEGFCLGFIWGLSFFLGLFYPIFLYGWPVSLASLLYVALNFGIFCFGVSCFQPRLKRGYAVLFPALIWTSLEFLRTWGSLSAPINIGIFLYRCPKLIQIASLTGVYGVSFLILLVNSILSEAALWLFQKNPQKRLLHRLSLPAGILTVIIGIIMITSWQVKNPSPSIKVSIIQGSIPTWLYNIEKWEEKYAKIVEQTYLQLTEEALKEKPKAIIWPETAIYRWIMDLPEWREKLVKFAHRGDCLMIVGAPSRDEEGNKHNSIFVIAPNGEIIGQHNKIHLVPFAETRIYEPGKKLNIVETDIGKLGFNICFESIYPSISRKLVQKGANLIIISTNDAGFKRTSLPYFHAASAVFRAIENRVYVVRAAQGGISLVIDPYGRILKESTLFEPTILSGNVGSCPERSYYTKFGDIFCWLCLSLTLFLAFQSFLVGKAIT